MRTTIYKLNTGSRFVALSILVAGLALSTASAQGPATLVYDIGTNPGWFDANAWSTDSRDADPITFNTTWIDGSVVTFPASSILGTVYLTDNVTIANFDLGSGSTDWNPSLVTFQSSTGAREIRFSGVLDFMGTWGVRAGANVSLQGNFTMTRGWLRNGWSHAAPYAGTNTLSGGTFTFMNQNQLGMDSHFIVEGGTLTLEENLSGSVIGSIELNSGTVRHGRYADRNVNDNIVVKKFSGTGGVLEKSSNDDGYTYSFTVDQDADTTFGGAIAGVGDTGRMQFIKTGSGGLALSGDVELMVETQVTGGSLFINSTNTAFSDEAGTTAIRVDGGTLGGTGTVTVTDVADVVVSATGKLAAGIVGAPGRTTYAFNGGTLDLSAATASANTGWLKFDLGDPATPGVTYDQIHLSSGTLNIGTGLDFDAFDIQLPPEPQSGSYILFETGETIIGSLGNATGTFEGPGRITGELRIDGNNLVMDVVVPPVGTMIQIR